MGECAGVMELCVISLSLPIAHLMFYGEIITLEPFLLLKYQAAKARVKSSIGH